MAVSRALRFSVLKRDNHTCRYCGAAAPDVKLTVDHVIPVALGGDDKPTNLVTACQPCNAGKGATPLEAETVADIEKNAIEHAHAIKLAAEMLSKDLRGKDSLASKFNTAWEEYEGVPRPPDWEISINAFAKRGLTWDHFESAIHIAMTNTRVTTRYVWRYFCGVCHNYAKEIEQLASDYLKAKGNNG